MTEKPFKLPEVQVYENLGGQFRVRAGKITLSITQALDLAFRLHSAAIKAAELPRNKPEAHYPLGCPCRLSNTGHIHWEWECEVHGEMAQHFSLEAKKRMEDNLK